jgi:hypothetical protein
MPLQKGLPASRVSAIFMEGVTAAGGTVSETIHDGECLFARAVLPGAREVRAGDALQGGVALRMLSREIRVHPYVFRQICRNGAILAHALQTRRLDAGDYVTSEEAEGALREAVAGCCEDEVFVNAAEDLRVARGMVADVTLNLLPVLARMRPEIGTQIFRQIVERFFDGEDASRYGLMNAVTSVARDTADPEVRWNLEELGGGIPVGLPPAPDLDDVAAEAVAIG